MNVVDMPLESIIPYAPNPRVNDGAVAAVAGSIREFGVQQPIVVDANGVIVVGHTRLLAARQLGLSSFPVVVAEGLSAVQAKAYRIADNRVGELAEWDSELLRLEIGDLGEMDFDLDLLGFGEEIGDWLGGDEEPETEGDTEPEIDRAEELREKWGVETGQLWKLGEHLLLCGDSTKADHVARLMDGEKAGICFTSPPYGQQREYTEESELSDWDALMEGVFQNLPMAEDGQVLVNLGLIHKDCEWVPYWDDWISWMVAQGWRRFGWYVWDQGPGLPGDWNGRLAPAFEFVFHFNKEKIKPKKTKDCVFAGTKNYGSGLRKKNGTMSGYTHAGLNVNDKKIPDSVFRVCRHKARGIEVIHSAVYPVGLAVEVIDLWSGIAYEPFSGSGTTIIACENLKRKCRAIEISPAYVAIAIQRWADHTGREPEML